MANWWNRFWGGKRDWVEDTIADIKKSGTVATLHREGGRLVAITREGQRYVPDSLPSVVQLKPGEESGEVVRRFTVSVGLMPEAIERLRSEGIGGSQAHELAEQMLAELYPIATSKEQVNA